eukprot:2310938-Prymnesium_polylepis.1
MKKYRGCLPTGKLVVSGPAPHSSNAFPSPPLSSYTVSDLAFRSYSSCEAGADRHRARSWTSVGSWVCLPSSHEPRATSKHLHTRMRTQSMHAQSTHAPSTHTHPTRVRAQQNLSKVHLEHIHTHMPSRAP